MLLVESSKPALRSGSTGVDGRQPEDGDARDKGDWERIGWYMKRSIVRMGLAAVVWTGVQIVPIGRECDHVQRDSCPDGGRSARAGRLRGGSECGRPVSGAAAAGHVDRPQPDNHRLYRRRRLQRRKQFLCEQANLHKSKAHLLRRSGSNEAVTCPRREGRTMDRPSPTL